MNDVVTDKQEMYYNFISDYYDEFNVYPKLKAICEHFKVIPQSALTVLTALEDKGYIEKNESDKRYYQTGKEINKLTFLQNLCLEYIVRCSGSIESISEISKKLGYPQTSIVSVFNFLERNGYIQKIPVYYKVLKRA